MSTTSTGVFGVHTNRHTNAVQGLMLSLIALLGLGVMMVFSSTGATRAFELRSEFLTRHLVFLGLSGLGMLIVLQVPTKRLLRLAPLLYLFVLGLLLLVLVPGIGREINGAQRWFRFQGVSLQPSELMKIALPLMLAALCRFEHKFRNGTQVVSILIVLGTTLVVACEPDLGTSVLLFLIGSMFLFLADYPLRWFAAGLATVVPLLGAMMLFRPYQLKRLASFVEALESWEHAQYQVKQSLLSIGSGGLWGVGYGRGLQKGSFLPESHTDFVFAVVGEEFGLIGSLATIGLWLLLFGCGVRLVYGIRHSRERFALAGTLLFAVVLQAGINVCVVTSLIPPKGISHPLLSYGGSNLLATMGALAVFLNVTRDQGSLYEEMIDPISE